MIFFHESLSSGLLVLSALLFSVTSLASLLLNLGPYYYEEKNAKKYLSSATGLFFLQNPSYWKHICKGLTYLKSVVWNSSAALLRQGMA
jgi:hypothetical protein